MLATKSTTTTLLDQQAYVAGELQTLFHQLLGNSITEAELDTTFLELGADSLILLQASSFIFEKFGVKIAYRLLLDDFATINALAEYLAPHVVLPSAAPAPIVQPASPSAPAPAEPVAVPAPERPLASAPAQPVERATGQAPGEQPAVVTVERVVSQQLHVMTQQLDLLRHKRPQQAQAAVTRAAAQPQPEPAQQPQPQPAQLQPEMPKPAEAKPRRAEFVAYQPVNKGSRGGLTVQQQQHLDALIARYLQRTRSSREHTQEYRPYLADNRVIAGFRLLWKDLCYPIVVDHGAGSRMWDIDGNEYLDLTMGFGTLIFGHSPRFITEGLEQELQLGMRLGPQSEMAGKVAKLLGELTHNERVVFCNSGTEAVMTALRLARTTTRRNQIALCPGSFHGTYDGTLVRGEPTADGRLNPVPMAPGVPSGVVQDVLLLPYDSPESIELLEAHGHELAAVLIEPTRSRHPDIQPVAFLHQLRQICDKHGIALIFDEIITGFRLHQGGAQALYGVQADLVTYGKALTGGVPIGVVAGKAHYLDGIDGGMWQYGDDSFPQAETTFFAGTFCKHPLAMSAAWSVLNHFKQYGPQLQEELTARVAWLTATLNAYFTAEALPIHVVNCGSLFRFHNAPEFRFMEVFFFHLIEKGIYIWEGRNCFLSTAHTQEDLELVVRAVQATIEELRAGGFLPPAPHSPPDGERSGGKRAAVLAAPVETRRLPLTEAQRNLWLANQLGVDSSLAYNQSLTLTIRGPLDVEALRMAVQQVVDRHEALRTTFRPEGDAQEIAPRLELDILLLDYAHIDAQTRAAQLDEWFRQEVRRPFDLARGPLLRFHVLRIAADCHLAVLTIHHLIIDGKSMGVVLTEIADLYTAIAAGSSVQLPSPVPFSDYAGWLQSSDQHAATRAAETYWRKRFDGIPPVLDLPTDRPRPPVQTFAGERARLDLPPALRGALQRLGARHGCTLYVTLLAGVQLWLHRLTHQTDVVVGVPAAGQTAIGADRLVGYCLNLLPVLSQLTGTPLFVDYLKTVKQALLDAQEHQNYPFGRLIELLEIPRDPSRPPLISVAFNLDMSSGTLDIPGLEVNVALNPSYAAAFDWTINITDTGKQLIVECDYNTDLFMAATMERLLGHLQTLLAEVVDNPQQRVSDIALLAAGERRTLLVEWNQTTQPYRSTETLPALFAAQVARTPAATALVWGDSHMSYHELHARANQLAIYLRQHGVGPESLVAVCLDRSPELVVALLGILKAGGAYVPLDPAYPPDRLAFMLEDSQAALLLSHTTFLAQLPVTSTPLCCIDRDLPSSPLAAVAPPLRVQPEQLAYMIYTSGSTGQPKGVQITHQALLNLLFWHQRAFGVTTADRATLIAGVGFDASVWELWPYLTAGASVAIPDAAVRAEPARLRDWLVATGATISFLPTALAELLLQLPWPREAALRQLLTGGDALHDTPPAGLPFRLINNYGPTENTVVTTSVEVPATGMVLAPPIGRPISNTQVYVLDQQLMPVPIGVVGELYIGGASLARGYWRRPDLTAERFVPNPFATTTDDRRPTTETHSPAHPLTRSLAQDGGPWSAAGGRLYKTGDQVRWRADGTLEFLGRQDTQVKLRGFRIELGEIERTLERHPAVASAVVLVRAQGSKDAQLVAYITEEPRTKNQEPAGENSGSHFSVLGSGGGSGELRAFLKQHLPEYMVPAHFVVLDALPLTPNGKINRHALPAPELSPTTELSYIAPRTPIEAALAGIWGEVLGHAQVGVEDNFFALGGHSLLAAQIISRMRESFQVTLALQDFFEAPNIAGLALRIVEAEVDQADPELLACLISELEEVA